MSDQLPQSPSRRGFLKTSTAAAVGAGVFANLNIAAGAFAGNDETIRIGLIGCGGRGTGAVNDIFNAETRGPVKLVAMGDAFGDSLEGSLNGIRGAAGDRAKDLVDVADDHKFVGLDAYQKVLATDVDLVVLATPPGFRPIHFEAAVAAGKHVFMEKPVATDAPGVRRVLEACKKAKEKDLKVGVGLQRHHQANYIETIKRIQDGAIGDVLALRVYWNSGGVWDPRKTHEQCKTEMEYQLRNWYYYNWLSGDHICEQHIHNLDVGNWVMNGYPVECHGIGGRQVRTDKKYGEIFDHFAVEYTFANGAKMFSQCLHQNSCWHSVTEHAHGTKGSSDISGGRLTMGSDKWRFEGRGKNPYVQEHDDMITAIRKGTPYNEGDNGAYSTLTAIMGRMACYGGKLVTWQDALESQLDLLPDSFAWDAKMKSQPDASGAYAIPTPGVTKAI